MKKQKKNLYKENRKNIINFSRFTEKSFYATTPVIFNPIYHSPFQNTIPWKNVNICLFGKIKNINIFLHNFLFCLLSFLVSIYKLRFKNNFNHF